MAQENVVFGLRTFEMMMMFITMLAKCRLKLEGETENMGVCTREWECMTAGVLMATPCTNSLGCESGGHKHEGGDGMIRGQCVYDDVYLGVM